MSDLLVLFRDERNVSIHTTRVTLTSRETHEDIPWHVSRQGVRDEISRIRPEDVKVLKVVEATGDDRRDAAAMDIARAETYEADAAKLRELVNARTPVITEAQIASWYDGPARRLRVNAAAWLAGADR